MSAKFRPEMIACRVPKWIVERTRENMENHCMSLGDAFDEAVRSYPRKLSKKLHNAWYLSNYREYIPSAYYPQVSIVYRVVDGNLVRVDNEI